MNKRYLITDDFGWRYELDADSMEQVKAAAALSCQDQGDQHYEQAVVDFRIVELDGPDGNEVGDAHIISVEIPANKEALRYQLEEYYDEHPDECPVRLFLGSYYRIDRGEQPSIYGYVRADTPQFGRFWVRAYSQLTPPEGEYGSMCVANATEELTEEEFLRAQESGWP